MASRAALRLAFLTTVAVAGCHLIGGEYELSQAVEGAPTSTSSGGGASTTTSGSEAQSSTGSAMPECVKDSDCVLQEETPCGAPACVSFMCDMVQLPVGTTCDNDTGYCTDAGECRPCTEDNHCQASGCSVGTCLEDGTCDITHLEVDTPCGPSQWCDGNGNCEGCNNESQCPGMGACINNVCAPPSCNDGILNQNETDVDCGGSCASKCPNGADCNVGGDCLTGRCAPGVGICVDCYSQTGHCGGNQYCETGGSYTCKNKKSYGGGCDEDYQCLGDNCCLGVDICGCSSNGSCDPFNC